jgi:hypothetical protein
MFTLQSTSSTVFKRAHRRFRLLAVTQHVGGDHPRPRAGDEAADRRRGAHRGDLVGDALREVMLEDVAALGEPQRVDVGVRGAKLRLKLLRQGDVDPVQAAPEEGGIGHRRAGHLLGDRGGEAEKARQARILAARVALAGLADAVEQAPERMLEGVEHARARRGRGAAPPPASARRRDERRPAAASRRASTRTGA